MLDDGAWLEMRELHGFLGNVHKEEPHLHFVGADDVGDDQVVGSIIAVLGGFACHGAGLFQDDFMGMEETRQLRSGLLTTPRGPGDDRGLGDEDTTPVARGARGADAAGCG